MKPSIDDQLDELGNEFIIGLYYLIAFWATMCGLSCCIRATEGGNRRS
jgi:hypothetical protein